VWIDPQAAGQNLSKRRSRDGETPAIPDEVKSMGARLLVLCKQVFKSLEDCIRLNEANAPDVHVFIRHLHGSGSDTPSIAVLPHLSDLTENYVQLVLLVLEIHKN
jgi:hypothetical protein